MALSNVLDRLRRLRFSIDAFTLAIVGMVVLASLFPARGGFASVLDVATDIGIAVLFFMHGAKLSRSDLIGGLVHWRLHLLVLASTYLLFPVVVVAFRFLEGPILTTELMMGLLFLAALPSTVQSSIAFTSVAGGNVAAAVGAASLSSIVGVFLTPLLVSLLIRMEGSIDFWGAVLKIVIQILLPFIIGHLARPLIGDWISKRKRFLNQLDRGTIIAIVYTAFSVSVVEGLWQSIGVVSILATALASIILFAIIFVTTRKASRVLGFSREDEITIIFCGSKKSLAAGMPMAKVLFPGTASLGAIVLPLMIFHQIQLMICAAIANQYAKENAARERAPSSLEA